jgi:hypothetical protein
MCPHQDEIIMDRSLLNEGALTGVDKLVHSRAEVKGQDFSEDLRNEVN